MKRSGAVFIGLAAAAFAVPAALVYLLGPGALPETPPVVLASAAPVGGAGGGSPAAGADNRRLAVDASSVQLVAATLSRADHYARELRAVTLWDGGSAARLISVWVRGTQTRLRIRDDGGETVKNVLLRDGKKWIWYSDRPGVWAGRAALGDADAYQALLSWEELLTVDRRAIRDAGYTMYADTLCIYARCAKGTLGYENLYYIAVDSGLLMGAETYDGDTLVYSLSSTAPDFSLPDEAVFEIPQG